MEDTERLWLISDALPRTQYELQIRAKDEYDGQWSDWTSPVHAHTWTGNYSVRACAHTHTLLLQGIMTPSRKLKMIV